MRDTMLVLLLAACFPQGGTRLKFEGSENVASVRMATDLSCILRTWRILGVFACPSPGGGVNTCLIVENAYPVGILEAVRQPWASHLIEAGTAFKAFEKAPRYGEMSSHTNASADGTRLQFSEAHGFVYVPDLNLNGRIPFAIPRSEDFEISYLSELDGYFWRTAWAEALVSPAETLENAVMPSCSIMPRPTGCAGIWGPWNPRIGFLVHPSEVIAGHLLALRSGRVASVPTGRVVLSPYSYEPRTGHYIQMIRPTRRTCVPIGSPMVRMIETGALSKQGAYLFVHFGIFRACRGCFPAILAGPRMPEG